MRYASRHVGRLRKRAADILSDNFPDWDVRPEDIRPVTGHYRTDWRADVYRWELFARHKMGYPLVLGCWLTLTVFVREASRFGCHVSEREIWTGPSTYRESCNDGDDS